MDAGFIHVVEIGQYFMTKDTGDFRQFRSVACREYTLPRSDGTSQPKAWIPGNTRIGPVLEIMTSCPYGKYGIEIRIWSLSEDNSQSCLGQNFLWIKQIRDCFRTTTTQKFLQIYEVTTDCEGFCSPIKGKSKTTKKRTC